MTTEFDIESFNSVAQCEQGFDLELMHDDGITPVGVVLVILGDQADSVAKYDRDASKKIVGGRVIAEKQKKESEYTDKLIDTMQARDIESALVRVTGWKNVTKPYSVDLMRAAFKRNPHWIGQVHKGSSNIGNFTLKPVQS